MENREKLESYEACDVRGAFSSSWIFQEFRSLWCFRRIPEERSSAHRIGICQTLVRRQSGKRVLDPFPAPLPRRLWFFFFFFFYCVGFDSTPRIRRSGTFERFANDLQEVSILAFRAGFAGYYLQGGWSCARLFLERI